MFKNQGFTLIEVMIVVAIIGILLAIAIPSYQNYRIKTNRTITQTEMIEIAKRISKYKISNRTFEGLTIKQVNHNVEVLPTAGDTLYDLTFDPATVGATSWTLIAKPNALSTQKNDGWICLDDQGRKSWSKGATTCNLSQTSTW